MKSQDLLLNTLTEKRDRINGYSHDEIGDHHIFTNLETPMRANAFMIPSRSVEENPSSTITAFYGGKFKSPQNLMNCRISFTMGYRHVQLN